MIQIKKLFYFSRSTSGMSLIEIMVVLVIMGLLGAGTSNLLTGVIKTQRKNNIKAALGQVRDNLKNTLNNDTAWNNTVRQYPAGGSVAIGCLQDNVLEGNACTHNSFTNEFIVRDALDAVYYQSNVPTAGFTQAGQACNSFSASGNDLCPYRYNLRVTLRCPNMTATCIKPKVIIEATFLVNPQDASSPAGQINPSEYTFQIVRNERLRYEPLQIVHRVNGNVNGGACNTGTTRRPLTAIVNDVGNNVLALAGNRFRLQAGIYDCKVTAQAFRVPNGFSINLVSAALANPIPIGNGFTSPWSSLVLTGEARFQITAPADFEVTQSCPGISAPFIDARNMGIPNPDYSTSTTFTEVNCVRTL